MRNSLFPKLLFDSLSPQVPEKSGWANNPAEVKKKTNKPEKVLIEKRLAIFIIVFNKMLCDIIKQI